MTRVKENFLTEGLSGKYGNKVVFRQQNGKTIFANPPHRTKNLTPQQLMQKELFLAAVDYAVQALVDPAMKEEYRKAAPLGSSAYNMAVADFLSLPKLVKIETNGYSGGIGNLITVVAEDKFRVKSVTLEIALPDGTVVEQGHAIQVKSGRVWLYAATVANPAPAGCVITATVTDVPNHSVSGSVTL